MSVLDVFALAAMKVDRPPVRSCSNMQDNSTQKITAHLHCYSTLNVDVDFKGRLKWRLKGYFIYLVNCLCNSG